MELTQLVGKLFAAIDADNIEAKALELPGNPSAPIPETQSANWRNSN